MNIQSKNQRQIGEGGKLSKEKQLERRDQILQLYSTGHFPGVIAVKLGTSEKIVNRELEFALTQMVDSYARLSPQHTFVRYAAFQMGVIQKLSETCEDILQAGGGRQATAAISALRTQSDIYDKILEKGIEFGVIAKGGSDATRDLMQRPSADLKIELRKEAELLLALLDEMETPKLQMTKREALKEYSVEDNSTKAKEAPNKDLSKDNWMYRKSFYDSNGKHIPKSKLSPKQRAFLDSKNTESVVSR